MGHVFDIATCPTARNGVNYIPLVTSVVASRAVPKIPKTGPIIGRAPCLGCYGGYAEGVLYYGCKLHSKWVGNVPINFNMVCAQP